MAPQATTFHRFTALPMEIQLLIWKEAVMEDKRIVPVGETIWYVFVTEELLGPPKFFLVCQASLTAARRFYDVRLRFRQPNGEPGRLLLSTTTDIFLIKDWHQEFRNKFFNPGKLCQTYESLSLAVFLKIRHKLDDFKMYQFGRIGFESFRPNPIDIEWIGPGYAAPENGHEDTTGRPIFEVLLAPNALLKGFNTVKLYRASSRDLLPLDPW
ncbi:uncharacterized protein PG986_005142 [Apiospora aurea]|uniref:2EXR domain-containing protein n=1 Tax=Apiospora aurea TaxID=335848 RepID=A0ABR1QGR4_9PEZI